MTAPWSLVRRKTGTGPHLTTRHGALFGIFGPALLAFSLLLLLIAYWIAAQFQDQGVAQAAFMGAGIGLLVNIALALPSRLVIPFSAGIARSRIDGALDASGFAPFRTDDCFAPKRWRGFQFPGQRIHLWQTERGTELVGPYAVLKRIKAIL